ncbi:hypothetical protein [Canibacter oris]|uniref:Bacterial EndoU nuclease domain-containing protein n=1 Tax=Canibacter oris TaxID=1365628 RepID=A0A840DK12_9MICO|nr:hypothetical protein [Canibacter oris]MBB4072055.1 hypothetical protein [Canibacter oris]
MRLQTPMQELAQQREITQAALNRVTRLWQTLGQDFSQQWPQVRGQITAVLESARAQAAVQAETYTGRVLEETGEHAPRIGDLNIDAFLTTAPDGRETTTLIEQAMIRTKTEIAQFNQLLPESAGMNTPQALKTGLNWLSMAIITTLADTRREIYQADITARPAVTGYVRMLNPPSCAACAVLAGKWYRWNEGFERHGRCDCQHIPASKDTGENLTTDPYKYFNSLNEKDQVRLFGKANAQAIRDGADIYRVANIKQRGLATPRGARRYGTPHRLTIDDIYEIAGDDRAKAIAIMRQQGYITGAQVRGGNIIGRFHEAYSKPISRPLVAGSKRERVLRARETGVRDPLDRATMTAAERRLHDAVYRREYAKITGYIPPSIGQESAGIFSTQKGVKADKYRLDLLERQIEQGIRLAQVGGSNSSMWRLYEALGLDDSTGAETAYVFHTQLVKRVGLDALKNPIPVPREILERISRKVVAPLLFARKKKDGRSVTRGQAWPDHKKKYNAERAKRAAGAGGGFPPRKGPPKDFPDEPDMPIGWPADLPELTPDAWNHILYGDNSGGGHKYGYGWRHNKSEFPEEWDNAEIMTAMVKTLRATPDAAFTSRGVFEHIATVTVKGKTVRVKVTRKPNGEIASAFPL